MKLIKFRIKNFKSIIDTGYCAFAPDMTILIGKNESGKTATLEALRYFNRDILRVAEDAFPLEGLNREPSVEIWFRLDRKEIEAIEQASGIKLSEDAADYLAAEGLGVVKNSRGRYTLNEECIDELFSGNNPQQPVKHIRSAKEKLQELLKAPHLPVIDYEGTTDDIQRDSKEFLKLVKSYLPSIKDELVQVEAVKAIRVIVKESARLAGAAKNNGIPQGGNPEQKQNACALFTEQVVQHLPHFIMFTEFDNILPFEIPIVDLKSNSAVMDFAQIAGLDVDYLMETQDVHRRIHLLNRISTTISGDFLEYWNQNKIELIVKSEGDKLLFGAKENGKTDFFKLNQRSLGFQWFLSFFLRLNVEKKDKNVILIDEPGMHLHGKAQRDILRVLENKIIGEAQVMFTTHCPYLIDPKRLDRVRLVIKDPEKGSRLTEDLHSYVSDESMLPVTTAMGGDKIGTPPLTDKQNVLISGIGDFYFWNAMKRHIKDIDLDKVHLLPAAEADKLEQLVSMMVGYNLKFQILLNHNNEGWKLGEKLKETFGFGNEKVMFVSETLGYVTEDLFTHADFNKFVLNGEAHDNQDVLNSAFVKANNINKLLIGRGFYERIEKGLGQDSLSGQTAAAFRDVFEKILNRFHGLPPQPAETKPESKPTGKIKDKELLKGDVKRRPLFAFLGKK